MTIRESYDYLKSALELITDEAESESRIIISFLVNEPFTNLLFSDKSLNREDLDSIIEKRGENIPLQYIIGKWGFYKGEFFVGKGVLIPRQDTEILVETVVELFKNKKDITIADLCAGSGCIGISLATDLKSSKVTCVEKYEEPIEFLNKNILHNNTKNVSVVKADVLEESFGEYDLIVSNPPYINEEDMKTLSAEVLNEPQTALFGGKDGLDFYRIISHKWKKHLKKNGILAFEVGINQAKSVCQILETEGFTEITVKCDLCGVQRVIFGTVNNL